MEIIFTKFPKLFRLKLDKFVNNFDINIEDSNIL